MKTLREIRMWHWRQVVNSRQLERDHEAGLQAWGNVHYSTSSIARHRADADRHLRAVQTLNEFVTGVAEYDCMEADGRDPDGLARRARGEPVDVITVKGSGPFIAALRANAPSKPFASAIVDGGVDP